MPQFKLLILDVDGVLTGGDLPYDADGSEIKVFHVKDGAAVKLWQAEGGVAAIISGRESPAVARRASDLGVRVVRQGVGDKLSVYEAVCREQAVSDAEVCVVGDDLPDLPLMQRCGYAVAVANAVPTIKRAAHYVTRRAGGQGVVAEIVERLLLRNGSRPAAVKRLRLCTRS